VHTRFGLFVSFSAENNNSKVNAVFSFVNLSSFNFRSRLTHFLHIFFQFYSTIPDSTLVPFTQLSSLDLSSFELSLSSWIVCAVPTPEESVGILSFLLDYQHFLVGVHSGALLHEENSIAFDEKLTEWNIFAACIAHQLYSSPSDLVDSFRSQISERRQELFISFSNLCVDNCTIDGGSLYGLVQMYFSHSTSYFNLKSISSLLLKYLRSLDENNMVAVLSIVQLVLQHLCMYFVHSPFGMIDSLGLFLGNILFLRRKLFGCSSILNQ
jgi:hypothetical protein